MEEESTQQVAQPSAESPEFDEAIRSGRFDAEAPSADIASDTGWPAPFQAALDELDGKPADEQPKEEAAPAEETKPEETTAQAPAPADWERKYNSVAGNNRQLQQALAEQKRQHAELTQRLAQIERQAQQERDIAGIKASVPEELHDAAIADYHAKQQSQEREQGLEAYRQFLQAQQGQIQQAQLGMFQQQITTEAPDFAKWIAEREQAPEDLLVAAVQTPAWREAMQMTRDQEDYDRLALVLQAVAQVEAAKDRERKEANRQNAVSAGTHRDVANGSGGSGSTGQTIETRITQMTDEQFRKFSEKVAATGGLRGL